MFRQDAWRARIGLALLALLFAILSSGCWLRGLVLSVSSETGGYPYYDSEYTITFGASSLVADCSFDTEFFGLGCLYFLYDENGFIISTTSTAQLIIDFGVLGAFIDPLVLQVPQSVTSATGTVTNGNFPVPPALVITQTSSFKAGPSTTVTAEPGQKFLILELPSALADAVTATDPQDGHEFQFSLQLVGSEFPISVKSMFTVRVDAPDGTYYLPMLPCTNDFASIPPLSLTFETVETAEDDVLGLFNSYASLACNGKVYDLRAAPGPPGVLEYAAYVPAIASD